MVLVIALGLVLVAVLATATVLILRGRDDKPTAAAGSKQPRNQLAIVVGDKVVSAPSVNAPIIAGKVQIAGNLTQKDAEKLAADITG